MRTALLVGMALLAVHPVMAQDAPTLSTAVVAVVDLGRVSDESLIGKSLAQQLGELQAELERTLNERRTLVENSQAEFQSLVEAYQAEMDSLPEAEARQREGGLMEQQQALQELMQAAQVDANAAQRRLQDEVGRLTAELDQDIRPHINAVAEELGVDVLIPVSQTVYANPALDVTDLVIERVDQAFGQG